MSQFNPNELASHAKQEVKTKNKKASSNTKAKKLPLDALITHHGKTIGEFSTISAGIRCDCPEGSLHSNRLGEDYAYTVSLSGGDVGISCSGDSCCGLFIPETLINPPIKPDNSSVKLDVRQLDTEELLHFTEDMIPEPIRRWTLDNCLQTESSLNYGAISAIVICSNLIGYRCGIKPKVNANWKIIPNLWGMLIGNPSERKSPAMEQFIKPIKRLESEAAEVFAQNIATYESEKVSVDIANKVKKKAIERAYEKGIKLEIDKANAISSPTIKEPLRERFILNDGTTEAAGKVMSDNNRTLLLIRDELSGFFASFQKAGREGDRSFYLEAHKGDSSYTYDRIGRGTVHIERLSIGILGTIQPSVLSKYILPKKDDSGDGLAQRMQLTVFSDNYSKPYHDELIDKDAVKSAYNIFKMLAYESYERMAGVSNDTDGIPYFHFNDEAQTIFVTWYNMMKIKEHNESDDNIQAHIGKYYGLLPSLALTFFMIDKVANTSNSEAVGVSHIEMAIKWCDVLETHARKMYTLSDTDSIANIEQKTNLINIEQKIIEYVSKNQDKLPMSFGRISQGIRGASAADIEKTLKDIADIEDKKVMKLMYNSV